MKKTDKYRMEVYICIVAIVVCNSVAIIAILMS